MTKQFLILLDWYEYNLTGIVRAKNKIKALEKILLNQINQNKKINKWDLSDNIPNFYYDDDLTDRQNIAKYLKQILNNEIRCLIFEINQSTNGFINYNYKQNNHLKGFKNHNGNYNFIQIENTGA